MTKPIRYSVHTMGGVRPRSSRGFNRQQAKQAELWKYAFQQAVVLQFHLREFYRNQHGLMLEDNYPEATRQQMISAKVYKEMSHWLEVVL